MNQNLSIMQDYLSYVEESKLRIAEVLDSFKIKHGEVTHTPGPTVTLFEFKPAIGVRLTKIKNLKDEFTIALESESVRVIAPIPGRGTVGIEVPNKERQNVPIEEMLSSYEYAMTDMTLPLAIGRKTDNSIFMVDLAEMPHLLVAGATGMGKSVGLNVILTSLLRKRTPEELKLVLIDPKQVELSVYDNLGKAYLAKYEDAETAITTDTEKARLVLESVCNMMESRYSMLKEKGVRNIKEYNAIDGIAKLPYYVVVIDEYGDLIMQSNGRDMENAICRIAQKARAVGIHMIISTQRPSATIVTGNIKANFPTRISFRTTTGTDSRVILDRVGAERLTGRGDMLFFNGGDFTRVQCAYISTEDVVASCKFLSSAYSMCEQTVLKSVEVKNNDTYEWHYIRPCDRTYKYPIPEARAFYVWAVDQGGICEADFPSPEVKTQLMELGLVKPMNAITRSILVGKEYCVTNAHTDAGSLYDAFFRKGLI